jgi:copper transport protein
MHRLAVATSLALAAVMWFYSPASAHVTLVSAEPAPNALLGARPASLRLEFSETVEPAVVHVSIVTPDGRSFVLAIANEPHDAHIIVAQLGAIGTGTFRVMWHVLSEDGHPVGGSYVFTVGTPTAPPPTTSPTVTRPAWGPTIAGAPLIPSVLRGLGVGSLAALAGLLFFVVTTRTRLEAHPARVALGFSIVAPLLLIAHWLAWMVNASPEHRLTVDWLSSALGTIVGRLELWRSLLALLPLWALVFARRAGLALLLTAPSLFLSAAIGHAATFQPSLSVPLKAAHITALAAWLGGLLWIVVANRRDMTRFATDAARVSSIALWSVIAIAISGTVQVVILVPTLSDLRSAYGATVLAKVIGLGALVAFGTYHRRRVLPTLATDYAGQHSLAFQASLRREISVMWLVILLGGFLGYVSPPASSIVSNQPSAPDIIP